MSGEPNQLDDLSALSPEDRAIVLRGRALLQSLKGKPKVSRLLQERVDSETMDLAELQAKAAETKSDKS